MLEQLAAIVVGVYFLARAAHEAMRRLVRLARHAGMSEFSISFIVAGIVSISPELSIAVNSALSGDAPFGAGIVLGSNVADLTLVIGAVALASGGLSVKGLLLKRIKYFIVPLALPLLLFADGELSRLDGCILVAAFAAYVFLLFRERPRRAQNRKVHADVPKEAFVLLISLAVLLAAGNAVTGAAHSLSVGLGVPLLFLGILLAVGTCLPELTLALDAANGRHGEVGLGNVFGNVLADCMLTLGVVAIIAPVRPEFPQIALFSAACAVAATVAIIAFASGKRAVSKRDGVILVLAYVAYLVLSTLLEMRLAG